MEDNVSSANASEAQQLANAQRAAENETAEIPERYRSMSTKELLDEAIRITKGDTPATPEAPPAELPPPQTATDPTSRILRNYEAPPPWFTTILADMLALYPQARIDDQVIRSWWFNLRDVGPTAMVPLAIEVAMREAPRRCDPFVVPTCEMVRRFAVQMIGALP